jgi:hypothetical protein
LPCIATIGFLRGITVQARIYKPARTAMQRGTAKTKNWILEFEQQSPRSRDPLMGWTSAADTTQQVHLFYATKEEAIAYAEANGITYQVTEPHEPAVIYKAYADNFRWDRPR